MKIIISHDIDHLHWTDHFNDFFIPKFIARESISLIKGHLSRKQYVQRLSLLKNNRQHRLPELIKFNKYYSVKPTFFVGLDNALSLSYSKRKALNIIRWLKNQGFEVGVHGIAFDVEERVNFERKAFAESGFGANGIRMHYLRNSTNTLMHIANAGYEYDSTLIERRNPFKTADGLVEFPVSTMDVYAAADKVRSYEDIRKQVEQDIELAVDEGLRYYTVIFHDLYFDPRYHSYYAWYRHLVEYCTMRGYQFIDFKTAISEMYGSEA